MLTLRYIGNCLVNKFLIGTCIAGSAKSSKCEKKEASTLREERRKHRNRDKDKEKENSDSHKSTEQSELFF